MTRILYIGYTKFSYSLNAVYIKGLKENGIEVWDYKLNSRSILSHIGAIIFVFKNKKLSDALFIGYDSSALTVFLRPFYGGRMIYCAVLPVYERLITSRQLAGKWSLKAAYYWFIDFVAYHVASLSMIESDSQINYISKFYFVSKKKLFKAWIGVDENNFFYDPSIEKSVEFTVLFRGSLMPEAGAEYLIQAAKILEDEPIKFIMLSGGMLLEKTEKLIKEINPKNLELRSELLSYDELRSVMLESHLSIGQLSDHPRLDRTIPHKVYESLAMKVPYLTASNIGISELVQDGKTCITCKPADAQSLVDKIIWAKDHPNEIQKIADNGYEFYKKELTSKILVKKLLDKLAAQ